MENDLIRLLHEGDYSCVISNEVVRTFSQRGVLDLYLLLRNEPDFLRGACMADKVVGKGAAALMVLGKIEELYADVISESAWNLLQEAGIRVECGQLVPHIVNRLKTDWCPVEKLCSTARTAEECLPLIEGFINR